MDASYTEVTACPVAAASFAAAIAVRVFGPSRLEMTGIPSPETTPRKVSICRLNGSPALTGRRSRPIGFDPLGLAMLRQRSRQGTVGDPRGPFRFGAVGRAIVRFSMDASPFEIDRFREDRSALIPTRLSPHVLS
jgi:hypothetical protein